jgi:hypothetical protein
MIVRSLAQQANESGDTEPKRIIYIDTDTTFTAYLLEGFILKNDYNLETKHVSQKRHNNDALRGQNYSHNNEYPLNKIKIENERYQDCVVDNKNIQIFLPSGGHFESTLGDVISSIHEASIVIFDSLNSFYNLYPLAYADTPQPESRDERYREPHISELMAEPLIEERKNGGRLDLESLRGHKLGKTAYSIGRLNHLLSIYVMLLVKHGVTLNVPVLVTSMVRYKKVSEGLWVKAPTCGRLLHQKSYVKMSVEMSNEYDISVNLLRHPSLGQQTVVFPNTGLYSAFEINQGKS